MAKYKKILIFFFKKGFKLKCLDMRKSTFYEYKTIYIFSLRIRMHVRPYTTQIFAFNYA